VARHRRRPARAEIATAAAAARAEELMARKYRVDRVLILPLYRAVQRLIGRPVGGKRVVLPIPPAVDAALDEQPVDAAALTSSRT
jgi:hypothetical protein